MQLNETKLEGLHFGKMTSLKQSYSLHSKRLLTTSSNNKDFNVIVDNNLNRRVYINNKVNIAYRLNSWIHRTFGHEHKLSSFLVPPPLYSHTQNTSALFSVVSPHQRKHYENWVTLENISKLRAWMILIIRIVLEHWTIISPALPWALHPLHNVEDITSTLPKQLDSEFIQD